MAIEVCIQRGSVVYVYGNSNRLLFSKSGKLSGYTSGSVTVLNSTGKTAITYDEKGRQIGTHAV